MKYIIPTALFFCLTLISCNSDWEEKVVQEVTKMEEFMIETQLAGDYEKQLSVFSDEYGYIDISGKRVTKEQLKNRRDEDHMKAVRLDASELEVIPLSPSLAISRGRWDGLNVYYGAIPRTTSSRYMAIWRKEKGAWKMLADQVTDIVDREIQRPVIELASGSLRQHEGKYRLETDPEMEIALSAQSDTLRLMIPGQLDDGLKLYPSHDHLFFAGERPWEIKFITPDSIRFISWGHETIGKRVSAD